MERKELQLLELEIAKEIKRICDENNIEYFMIGGTLLGAVRHKGFIPWDDDIDIGMTNENYERFLEIAPSKLDCRFFLQCRLTDDNFAYPYAKVRMNNTHMHELVNAKVRMHDGIFVDIFPYDQCTENKATSKFYMMKLQLLSKCTLLKRGFDLNSITECKFSKTINWFLKHFPASPTRVEQLLMNSLKTSPKEKNTFYIERDGMFKGNFVFPKYLFNHLIELDFEDTTFKAPESYDAYLKRAYGNYMEFPPEREREIGHSVTGIILDKPYSSYFKGEVD